MQNRIRNVIHKPLSFSILTVSFLPAMVWLILISNVNRVIPKALFSIVDQETDGDNKTLCVMYYLKNEKNPQQNKITIGSLLFPHKYS